eukprot:TRINITY_DN7563_c0_g1_i3.p3 TRINITY_DN7563_c0_g1~~TRINITY_DN7563_c0_g1_i3.p3  ORF type:complete len:103 (-),score=24.19 TRINITY_DN7563_c0_g1_i3:51-359(-)
MLFDLQKYEGDDYRGGREYLAPEIVTGEEYSMAVDWWSVGTLIYEMLTGLSLFHSEDLGDVYRMIVEGGEIDLSKHNFSAEAQDIIKRFLDRDQKNRSYSSR